MRLTPSLLVLSLLATAPGCQDITVLEQPEEEGDEPGECSDGADNDLDGLFDCDDPTCAGAPACAGDDDDAVDDDDATADDDDSAGDDDDSAGDDDDSAGDDDDSAGDDDDSAGDDDDSTAPWGDDDDSAPCDVVPTYTLPPCAPATGVFFSDIAGPSPTIYRMDPNGSNLAPIHSAVADDLAVDLPNNRLYWVHSDAVVDRGPLTGGPVETVQPALPYAYGIELHPFAGRLYWTNQVGTPKVERSCAWGGPTTDVLSSLGPGGNCCAIGIAIDFVAERIYWMDGYYGGPITRTNLDGTGLQGLTTTVGIGNGIALDHAGGKMYWTEYGNSGGSDVIRRANLDGTGVETLLTAADGLDTPQHIAVDPAGGKIYWADLNATAQVGRANLDGSSVEMLFGGGGDIRAIALERIEPCM